MHNKDSGVVVETLVDTIPVQFSVNWSLKLTENRKKREKVADRVRTENHAGSRVTSWAFLVFNNSRQFLPIPLNFLQLSRAKNAILVERLLFMRFLMFLFFRHFPALLFLPLLFTHSSPESRYNAHLHPPRCLFNEKWFEDRLRKIKAIFFCFLLACSPFHPRNCWMLNVGTL